MKHAYPVEKRPQKPPIRTHTPTTCSVSCRTAGKGSHCRNGDSICRKFLIVLKSERGFDSLYALNIGGQIDEDQGKKEETHGQTGSCR